MAASAASRAGLSHASGTKVVWFGGRTVRDLGVVDEIPVEIDVVLVHPALMRKAMRVVGVNQYEQYPPQAGTSSFPLETRSDNPSRRTPRCHVLQNSDNDISGILGPKPTISVPRASPLVRSTMIKFPFQNIHRLRGLEKLGAPRRNQRRNTCPSLIALGRHGGAVAAAVCGPRQRAAIRISRNGLHTTGAPGVVRQQDDIVSPGRKLDTDGMRHAAF